MIARAVLVVYWAISASAVTHGEPSPQEPDGPAYTYVWTEGFIGSGNDVQPPKQMTLKEAFSECDRLPRCRSITYEAGNTSTANATVYLKFTTGAGHTSGWSTWTKFAPATTPAAVIDVGGNSELRLELRQDSFTVQSLNHTRSNVPYSFTRPLTSESTLPYCSHLGDMTIRLRRGSAKDSDPWDTFTTTTLGKAEVLRVSGNVLHAQDISSILSASAEHSTEFPFTVIRSYERSSDGAALVMKFSIKNKAQTAFTIGGLGFALPEAPGHPPKGIESTVWNDPHIGRDHGFVEFVRVVDDEKTLLVVAENGYESSTSFEAWRPVLEDLGGGDVWEWAVHSQSWASEWQQSTQYPFMEMSASTHGTPDEFPNAKTPWPSCDGHEGVPVSDEASFPFNDPTSATLEPGETATYAFRLQLADEGPRTRNNLLTSMKRPVLRAVPGTVISAEMTTAVLFVDMPTGLSVSSIKSETAGVGNGTIVSGKVTTVNKIARIPLQGSGRGRVRVSITFSDDTIAVAHYYVLPSFQQQVENLGQHFAHVAWLPRDFPDPFGRSASVMPWDRELKAHVLNDARAYDAGLSDDAGGGNPLGFASKVRAWPRQDEVEHLDDYIKYTLWGIKKDTARPPYKSLQVGGDPDYPCNRDGGPDLVTGSPIDTSCEGIRMTMFYYSDDLSDNNSGHFNWNYTEQNKCHLPFGGPTWCMTENMANATYRGFNYPHHTSSYWAMYHVARYFDKVNTYHPWQWYLWRAAMTAIKGTAGAGPGFMDGTVYREVLNDLKIESEADPDLMLGPYLAVNLTAQLNSQNLNRQENWARQPYPYGSEFGFDTTGQEEVVVWNMYFGNMTAAKRTVDHILSYMRSSLTWPYNGGARSWGDAGNNAKWLPSFGTGLSQRGQMHYRAGLNMIPLIEWYRSNPDDLLLLEISIGAIAGQLTNIDEDGAGSMMWHAEPHILKHDPHTGDFGLGFFGHSLEAGSYFVADKKFGDLCYLCDSKSEEGTVSIIPRDSYRIRVFLEPVALYMKLDAGNFASLKLDMASKSVEVNLEASNTFSNFRLCLEKTSTSRPGSGFEVVGVDKERGCYNIPSSTRTCKIRWD